MKKNETKRSEIILVQFNGDWSRKRTVTTTASENETAQNSIGLSRLQTE